jgi:hypothetical protein
MAMTSMWCGGCLSCDFPFIWAQFCCASVFSDRYVVQLKFVVREDADSLVVAANGDSGCLVEMWELREKPMPIHKLFQPKSHSSQPEPFKTVVSYALTHVLNAYNLCCLNPLHAMDKLDWFEKH